MKITITMNTNERNAIADICTATANATLIDKKKIPNFRYEMDKAMIVPDTKVVKNKAVVTTYDYKDSQATVSVDIRPDAMYKVFDFINNTINKCGSLIAHGLAIVKTCTNFIEDMKKETAELDKIFEYDESEKMYMLWRFEVGGYRFVAVYNADPDLNVNFYELHHASTCTPEKYVDVALGLVHAEVDKWRDDYDRREDLEANIKREFNYSFEDLEDGVEGLLYPIDEMEDNEDDEFDIPQSILSAKHIVNCDDKLEDAQDEESLF